MFGANAFAWPFFADGAVTSGVAALVGGGAGGAWRPYRAPKLLTADDVRRLLGRDTGILVREMDEDEELAALRMLGWL